MVMASSEGETDMIIYRGFDIIPAPEGFTIQACGNVPDPVMTEVFATEEKAMDHIDAMRKAARLAQA
jgi:hypothetical protein